MSPSEVQEVRLVRLETHFEHLLKTVDEMRDDAKATRVILEEIQKNGWRNLAILGGLSAMIGGIVTKIGTWLISHP